MHDRRPVREAPGLAVLVLIVGILVAACSGSQAAPSRSAGSATAWAQLDVADAHSLAFEPGHTEHLFFGHHGGLSESVDGGRTWRALGDASDAMSLAAGDGTTMYIAGHDVFEVSRDGGRTWQAVASDLPGLDIHGFAQSPLDPERMWAYLAGGGVYESEDGGAQWTLRYSGHAPFLNAVSADGAVELLALDPMAGIAHSTDDGATWSLVASPPSTPVVSLTSTIDGRIVILGARDGIYRSDDGGRAWRQILQVDLPLAIAVSDGGLVVATVTRTGAFFRSDDGGSSWPGP